MWKVLNLILEWWWGGSSIVHGGQSGGASGWVGGQHSTVGRTNKRGRAWLPSLPFFFSGFPGFALAGGRKGKKTSVGGREEVVWRWELRWELVRVGEWERGGGGKKATRSRHGAVFSIPRYFFLFPLLFLFFGILPSQNYKCESYI